MARHTKQTEAAVRRWLVAAAAALAAHGMSLKTAAGLLRGGLKAPITPGYIRTCLALEPAARRRWRGRRRPIPPLFRQMVPIPRVRRAAARKKA